MSKQDEELKRLAYLAGQQEAEIEEAYKKGKRDAKRAARQKENESTPWWVYVVVVSVVFLIRVIVCD